MKFFRRAIFGALGLRQPIAQHTDLEAQALAKWAQGAKSIVEIGVAEGASARIFREVMADDGYLYLIDPYTPGKLGVNMAEVVAHRAVRRVNRGSVHWIKSYSADAGKKWNKDIDFLFIDGDHSYAGVKTDWALYSPHVVFGGVIALHDAWSDGQPSSFSAHPNDGPVKLVREILAGYKSEYELIDRVHRTVFLRKISGQPIF